MGVPRDQQRPKRAWKVWRNAAWTWTRPWGAKIRFWKRLWRFFRTPKKKTQGKGERWGFSHGVLNNQNRWNWKMMMWFFCQKNNMGGMFFEDINQFFLNWYLLYTKYMSNCILIYYFIQGSVFWRMQFYIESMIRYGDPWVSLSSSHRYRFKENATKIEHQFV